jgi:hypothetical protein
MTNSANLHRNAIEKVLSENTFEHQRNAAQKAFKDFENNRAVVIAAEMQSGKSGIALALSGMQRQKLSDADICDRKQLRYTVLGYNGRPIIT